MALINCPECTSEISDMAAACPHCGCPRQEEVNTQKATFRPTNIIKIVGALFIVFLIATVGLWYNENRKIKVPAGPLTEADFIFYDYSDNKELIPSEDKNQSIVVFDFLSEGKDIYTARGIRVGDSVQKLAKRYGTLIPKYVGTEYIGELDGLTLDELSERYSEFSQGTIYITLPHILHGELNFTLEKGRISRMTTRTAVGVRQMDEYVQERLNELQNSIK